MFICWGYSDRELFHSEQNAYDPLQTICTCRLTGLWSLQMLGLHIIAFPVMSFRIDSLHITAVAKDFAFFLVNRTMLVLCETFSAMGGSGSGLRVSGWPSTYTSLLDLSLSRTSVKIGSTCYGPLLCMILCLDGQMLFFVPGPWRLLEGSRHPS